MITRRYVSITGAGGVLAAAMLFACATNDEIDDSDLPQPESGSPVTAPEAGTGGDADPKDAADVITDGGLDGTAVEACSAGGFCYTSLPIEAPLVGVSGSAADDVWAVGGRSILRFRGASWDEVYAFAGDVTPANVNPLVGIWANDPENVWAWAKGSDERVFFVRYMKVGGAPLAFHESATTLDFGLATSIWVTPASDAAWAATGKATITRFTDDGSGGLSAEELRPMASPADTTAYVWKSVWGFGPDDVYVAGEGLGSGGKGSAPTPLPPQIAHWNGADWNIVALPLPVGVQSGVLRGTLPTSSAQQLWLKTYDLQGPTVSLYPIEQSGELGGALLREKVGTAFPCGSDHAWAFSQTAAWMSNGLTVCRWDGAALTYVPSALGELPSGFVRGIWGVSDDDIWIVGEAVPQGPASPTSGFAARRKK